MYNLEFLEPDDNGSVIGKLVVKRTSDIIEILRRPSLECEPVIVEKERLVFDRFSDKSITYDDDTALLRPWVERRNPFPTTKLNLPPTAKGLVQARRWPGLELRITHEKGVCTKSTLSKDKTFKDESRRDGYLQDLEGPPGQPDSLYFETTKGHGACWRVIPEYDDLSEDVIRLDSVMMKGHALTTLLKTGALVYKRGSDWIIHEFNTPDISTLPKEFRESYSIVETYRKLVPKILEEQERTGIRPPERKELWQVSVTWAFDHVVWSASSDASNQLYQGKTFTVPLYAQASLEHNQNLILESIAYHIPEEKIRDCEKLSEDIRELLEAKGFKPELVSKVQIQTGLQYIELDEETNKPLWSNEFEYSARKKAVQQVIARGEVKEGFRQLEDLQKELEKLSEETDSWRIYLIELLLIKNDLMEHEVFVESVSPTMRLQVLDQIYELSQEIEGWKVRGGKTEFLMKLRKTLDLRKRLRSRN